MTECKEDLQHLQGLPPLLAEQADLNLCCKENAHEVVFPVHRVIISAHSPVLSKALTDLRSSAVDAGLGSKMQLPMIGDSVTAVREVLFLMYRWFTSDTATPRTLLECNSGFMLSDAKNLILAHKYSMNSILLAQEEAILDGIREVMFEGAESVEDSYSQYCSRILEYTSVAEQCGCITLLTFCEAWLVAHFHYVRQMTQAEL